MRFQLRQHEQGGWSWEAVGSRGNQLVSSPAYPSEAECRKHMEDLEKRIAQRLSHDPRDVAERRTTDLLHAVARHIALTAELRRNGLDTSEAERDLDSLAERLQARLEALKQKSA